MELNQNHARSDSANLHPPSDSATEISLYDELLSFSALSPPERMVQVNRATEQQTSEQIEEINIQPETQTLTPEPPESVAMEEVEDAVSEYPAPEQGEPKPESFPGFGKSGPLGRLAQDFYYTGALSPGVCLGCGAESGAEDLFCITCGEFVDEVASALPSKPTCAECGLKSSADEIFCPGCGANLTTS